MFNRQQFKANYGILHDLLYHFTAQFPIDQFHQGTAHEAQLMPQRCTVHLHIQGVLAQFQVRGVARDHRTGQFLPRSAYGLLVQFRPQAEAATGSAGAPRHPAAGRVAHARAGLAPPRRRQGPAAAREKCARTGPAWSCRGQASWPSWASRP